MYLVDVFEILLDYKHVDKYELYHGILKKKYCELDYFFLILGEKQQNQISRDQLHKYLVVLHDDGIIFYSQLFYIF